jgi:8-oxo-dGTP diphosphatase
MRFCPDCGTSLVLKEVDKRQRAYCPECQHIHYEQLKIGAGALIELDKKILLLQRTQAPFAHCWNLPAGYVEADESPVQAVIREVYEEVGLQVEVTGLVDVYFFDDDPRGNGILVVYNCIIVGGVLTDSDEATAPTCFVSQDIPARLAGGGHDQAIRAWQELHL